MIYDGSGGKSTTMGMIRYGILMLYAGLYQVHPIAWFVLCRMDVRSSWSPTCQNARLDQVVNGLGLLRAHSILQAHHRCKVCNPCRLERFRLDIVLLIYSMTLVQSIAAGALRSLNENSLVEMELPGWLTSTAVCHQGEHVFESCYDLSKKSRL